jgi:nucleotide-binding universal stress UspA family protein
MTADRLLLPIDLAKCPMEIFPLANGFAKPFEGRIILLHVLDRRLGCRRPFAEDVDIRQAEQQLVRIGQYLSPSVEACFRVRIGVPHEEILAEASGARADLIILPVFKPSFWKRVVGGSACGETARNVVAGSPTGVFVVDVRARSNLLPRRTPLESSNRRAA